MEQEIQIKVLEATKKLSDALSKETGIESSAGRGYQAILQRSISRNKEKIELMSDIFQHERHSW